MASITGARHVALTVRDAASAAWYGDLLGMTVVMAGDDDHVKFRVLAHPESGWVVGVRQYVDGSADQFDEFRTGLDHLAFGVATRADLEAWNASCPTEA